MNEINTGEYYVELTLMNCEVTASTSNGGACVGETLVVAVLSDILAIKSKAAPYERCCLAGSESGDRRGT